MIMDIDLLSKMIGELVLDHDSVSLPGLGTFVAAEVPASFSDKGFTINPPYRKLSFMPSETSDGLLVRLYAERNSVDEQMAKAVILHFLAEMKEALKSRKTLYLSGLGRLRATKDNNFFFVPLPDLDIYPDGFGLEPVSLKNTALAFPNQPFGTAESSSWTKDISPLPFADNPVSETVQEPESGIVPDQVSETLPEPASGFAPDQVTETVPEPAACRNEGKAIPTSEKDEVKGPSTCGSRWWIWPVAIVGAAALALGVFVLLAHVVPDFIDSLLYTPEELRIINY